jgi:hypothetical protein
MLRLFSFVGVAFLAAAALALTHPTGSRVTHQERQPNAEPNDDPRGLRAALPRPTRPLHLARFSLN